jgi:RNA polymerase sigma-70 factor (ECF subfamily)
VDAAGALPNKPGKPAASSISTGPPKVTPLRELQLVELHRSGDPSAMGELLQAYQRRVYSICYRMVHDPELARDLAQDSLVKVLEGLASYDGRSKLSTWVIRVTMNCCLSYLRKRKLRSHLSLDEPIGPHGAPRGHGIAAAGRPAGDFGPAGHSGAAAPGVISGSLGGTGASAGEPSGLQRVEQAETRSMILAALASLDPDTRSLLVLRDMQDLDYEQIAAVIDAPIGTVKSRLFRARAALRQAMESQLGRTED